MVLLASDPTIGAGVTSYVILLGWDGDRLARIRDFRYAPYVMEALDVRCA